MEVSWTEGLVVEEVKLGMETNYSRCSWKRESLRKNPQKFPSLFEREEPLELHTGFKLVANCAYLNTRYFLVYMYQMKIH